MVAVCSLQLQLAMSMNKIQTFTFRNDEFSVYGQQNKPWFMVVEIMHVLEQKESSCSRKMLSVLPEWKKQVVVKYDRRSKNMWFVSEAGLYCLLMRTRKALCADTIENRFVKWVFTTLLPLIRVNQQIHAHETAEETDHTIINHKSKTAWKLITSIAKVSSDPRKIKNNEFWECWNRCKHLGLIKKQSTAWQFSSENAKQKALTIFRGKVFPQSR